MGISHSVFSTWYGSLIVMIACSYIIAKACDVFEAATDYLGRNFSDGVKGATFNAIGSSMPELLTTVFFLIFAAQKNIGRDFAASIGGDTGSAIFNSIIIPMLVIWVVIANDAKNASVKISKKVILRDGMFLIGAELLILILLSSDHITHWHGWIFSFYYLVYLLYTFRTMNNNQNSVAEKTNEANAAAAADDDDGGDTWYEKFQFQSKGVITTRSWILLIFSTLVIAFACAGLVEGCKGIANAMQINPLFVALILVAAASSVPDTIISMKDAKKGNYDDALSNVLGSNIFDITISMGLPLAIFLMTTGQRIDFTHAGPTFIDVRIMLLVVTMITMGIYYFSRELKKFHVISLALLYCIFISYSLGAADYLEGGNSYFSKPAGYFIKILRQPGGLGDLLENTADRITVRW